MFVWRDAVPSPLGNILCCLSASMYKSALAERNVGKLFANLIRLHLNWWAEEHLQTWGLGFPAAASPPFRDVQRSPPLEAAETWDALAVPGFRRLQGQKVVALQTGHLSGAGLLEGWAGLWHWGRRGPAVQTGKAPMPAVVGTGEHVVGGWDRLRSMANPGCAITVARVSLMDFFLFILL